MTRDELIEAMARTLCGAWDYVWDGDPSDDQTAPETDQPYDDRPSKALFRMGATEALAALEAARPDIAAVLRGDAVVVPREASEYDRGRRDMLNAILDPNPEINARLAALHERDPDPLGRLPFDVVAWVTMVAEQLGIEPKTDPAEQQPVAAGEKEMGR